MLSIQTCILEKNILLREGIKSFLIGTHFKAIAVGDLEEIPQYEDTPQLIIAGVNMQISTILREGVLKEQLEKCRCLFPNAKLVMLMSYEEIRDMFVTAALQVDGFVFRDMSCETFICYLQLAMAGEKAFPLKVITDFASGDNHHSNSNSFRAKKHPNLSDREVVIIEYLISGKSNKEIANYLYLTESTIKVHLKTILRKLNVKNRTQAAIWALGNGFEKKILHNSLAITQSNCM